MDENTDHFEDTLSTTENEQDSTQLSKKRRREIEGTAETVPQEAPNFRVTQDNLAEFRTLRKINIKHVRSTHHLKYLTTCLENRNPPKSLRFNIKPQVPDTTPRFLVQWETAQINFSLELVKQLIGYWSERC